MVQIQFELVIMGYSEYDKYHEVLICPACKAVYIDGDGCPNYCLECEACKEMTKLDDLDPTLLLEAQAEICISCSDVFIRELVDYKTKYPITHAENENKPIMGDHKGRT